MAIWKRSREPGTTTGRGDSSASSPESTKAQPGTRHRGVEEDRASKTGRDFQTSALPSTLEDEEDFSNTPIPEGNAACKEKGCPNTNAVPCSYIDRRRRRCNTTWCPDHYVLVNNHPYCRRHAGVITALGAVDVGALPDVENRAPSLVQWVAQEVDSDIRSLLTGVLSDRPTVELSIDPVRVIFNLHGRGRRWERNWKLSDHTGVTLRVTVEVDEENDPEITARVGRRVVMRAVPPWIAHRVHGETVAAEIDAGERRDFYRGLYNAIAEGVQHSQSEDEA